MNHHLTLYNEVIKPKDDLMPTQERIKLYKINTYDGSPDFHVVTLKDASRLMGYDDAKHRTIRNLIDVKLREFVKPKWMNVLAQGRNRYVIYQDVLDLIAERNAS